MHKRQPSISDLLQSPEQRKDMDAIDKFAKSKAKYPLLGMQLEDILVFGHTHRPYNDIENKVINAGAWLSDMEVLKWFEGNYGHGNACSGWYIEICNGEYTLLPYDIHNKTKEEKKNTEQRRIGGGGQTTPTKGQQEIENEPKGDKEDLSKRLLHKVFHKNR